MDAKSGYFLSSDVIRSSRVLYVNIQDGAERNDIASLLLGLKFQVL